MDFIGRKGMLNADNMVLVGELRVTFQIFFSRKRVDGIPPRPVWLHSHNRKKCLVPGLLQRRTYALFEFPSPCVVSVFRFVAAGGNLDGGVLG